MDMMIFSRRRKVSRAVKTLQKIDDVVNWKALTEIVKRIDKSNTAKGGRKPLPFEWKVKMLFLQYTFNLSDPELEDQLIDRLSFQRFVGINLDQEIPDFTTLWRFKEALIRHKLMDRIFSSINSQMELYGLILKKGSMVDATIIESTTKPMKEQKRKSSKMQSSSQQDTDARGTEKSGKKYYGYKGHIGADVQSKLIRKRKFTSANVHDSQLIEDLCSGDESGVWGDKAYSNDAHKRGSRNIGIYYGVLDKSRRGKALSARQKKRNRQKSAVRAAVEHPFAFMKNKLKMQLAAAKTIDRNSLRFDMNCIIYNVLRADYLLSKAT
jgi:transposase, IS5 family